MPAYRNFFTTQFATTAGLQSTAAQSVEYFILHPDWVMRPRDLNQVFMSGINLPTAINQIFKHLLMEGKIATPDNPGEAIFAPICLNKKEPIIDILASSADTVLDLKVTNKGDSLKSLKDYYHKVVLNLTPWLRQLDTPNGRTYSAIDVHSIHSLFVRGALCASYHDADMWLNYELDTFLVKSYALVLSDAIANMYNLTFYEQLDIMAPLTLYMCQLLSGKTDNFTHPRLFNRCTFLGNQSKLAEYSDRIKEIRNAPMDLISVCQVIAKMGTQRMENFNLSILLRMVASLGPTAIQSTIALDYPPYWTHLLLLAISGNKLGMEYRLKHSSQARVNSLFDETKKFAHALNTSPAFIGTLDVNR